MASSSRYSTVLPPSATNFATRWASSDSASTRTSSRSRSESLIPVAQSPRMLHASSSTKNGLPSERANTSSTRASSGGPARIEVICRRTSSRLKRANSIRSTVRSRSVSARKGRSGWRRWMSSVR